MTVIEHVREILAASISEPLADVGICLTDDRSGYTIARYEGRNGDFDRSVTFIHENVSVHIDSQRQAVNFLS